LSVIEVFSKAFVRASLPVKYTEGFNPLPRINFAAPLSVGVIADSEIAVIETRDEIPVQTFIDSMNQALPEGFVVGKAYGFTIPEGVKKVSAAAILWGFSYIDDDNNAVLIPAAEEKGFRLSAQEKAPKDRGLCLHRTGVLAKHGDTGVGESYFDTYARLYEQYRK
jgi:radical SAM-linked protein